MRFADRREAGALLGQAVVEGNPLAPLVAALPRGGVPVGFEVSRVLGCDLDVLVVRKVGVPFQPELAMGAVGERGVVIENREVMRAAHISERVFEAVVAAETAELEARVRIYREVAEPIDPAGRTVIITDDGLATGSSALAAIDVARAAGALAVWVAVPVAPADSIHRVEAVADQLIVLHRPHRFMAVGAWYRDFSQTSNDEVRDLLRRSREGG
ncbi:MAG TPA: phosphoribosyltransferase family protein [Acidimicrobiia bacterium]|nr:phosphoribosyltransferase family protein [Acidimicrobiia bacterium]